MSIFTKDLDFGKVLVDYDFEAFFRKYIPDTERCQAYDLSSRAFSYGLPSMHHHALADAEACARIAISIL